MTDGSHRPMAAGEPHVIDGVTTNREGRAGPAGAERGRRIGSLVWAGIGLMDGWLSNGSQPRALTDGGTANREEVVPQSSDWFSLTHSRE
ncbi:hypothetical protein chiPu_0022530 [Chiloscyllium punctatum]|uniref:Uncharacterized protein n=1 Tax=Chiloscyllium punctatum TaxID=137246 RepID=A0A401RJJ9_CHIPU|nr:hypothetical protein [Chiloscyllium punctatum]